MCLQFTHFLFQSVYDLKNHGPNMKSPITPGPFTYVDKGPICKTCCHVYAHQWTMNSLYCQQFFLKSRVRVPGLVTEDETFPSVSS